MSKATLIIPALLLGLSFVSCKKGSSPLPQNNPKKYKVTFNMASGLIQTIQNLKTGKQQTNSLGVDTVTTNIAAYAPVIILGIYTPSGSLIRQLVQKADSVTNYGVIVDSLAAGTYTIVAAAGQPNLQMGDATGYYGLFYNKSYSASDVPSLPWQDTFFDQLSLTVSNGPVDQAMPMTRIDGKLEIDFNDVIPANASRLDVEISKENFDYNVTAGTVGTVKDTITYHIPIPAAAIGTSTYSVSEIVLNTTTPFSVVITGYDSANNVIATHTVTNVSCTANQRTILTGSFADSGSNSGLGFHATLVPVWSAPNLIHF